MKIKTLLEAARVQAPSASAAKHYNMVETSILNALDAHSEKTEADQKALLEVLAEIDEQVMRETGSQGISSERLVNAHSKVESVDADVFFARALPAYRKLREDLWANFLES